MSSVSAERSYSAVSGDETSVASPLGQDSALGVDHGMGTLTQIFQDWSQANCGCSRLGSWAEKTEVELELCTFQGAVHVLLRQYLDGGSQGQLDLALAAYDVGLADGFYGSGSAIAKGLATRYELMIGSAKVETDRCVNWDLLSMILVSARLHAKNVRDWHQAVLTGSGN